MVEIIRIKAVLSSTGLELELSLAKVSENFKFKIFEKFTQGKNSGLIKYLALYLFDKGV